MNRATRSQSSGNKKGCGCGQSGSGCSCGGECGECHVKGLVRPLFFAGQLLTEDDLGALTDYVRAKNRLHNQALFGAGVVNGLHVSCHPCDGGRVVVQPGYAIDCCGNDLVLPAAQEVDIQAMVRRLALERLGGIDCGDPCPPPAEEPEAPQPVVIDQGASRPQPERVSRDGARASTDKKAAPPRPAPRQRYGLYLRYCETETDPVAAYATDEACGERSCEATRVREGVRFELRCCEEPAKDDILMRIGQNLGDLVSNERSVAEAVVLQLSSSQLEEALLGIEQGKPFDPDKDQQAVGTLTGELQLLRGQAWGQNEVLHAADLVRRLGALVTLFRLSLRALGSSNELSRIIEAIGAAQAELREAEGRLKQTEPLQKVDVALMRDVILATVSLSDQYARYEEESPSSGEQPEPQAPPFQEQLFSRGGVFTTQLQSSFSRALDALRASLYERLGASPLLADCRLRGDLQGILLPGEATSRQVARSDVQPFIDATTRLGAAALRFVLDAVCAALNPPAQACDDTAVLLACVSVEQCQVVDVCSMERTYVLSGAALRYWVPPLGWLGAIFEWLCCDARSVLVDLGQGRGAGGLIDRLARGPGQAAAQLGSDGLASYYGLRGLRVRELERLAELVSVLGRTTSRQMDLRRRLRAPEPSPSSRAAAPPPPQAERAQPRPEPAPIDINAIVDQLKRDPQALAALADAVAKAKRGRN